MGEMHYADRLGCGRFATRCGIQIEMPEGESDPGVWRRRTGGAQIAALANSDVTTCAACRNGLALAPLDPVVETTIRAAAELQPPSDPGNPAFPWRCFHCDEVFSDARAAADHFGTSENDTPACLEVASETEKAIVEDRRMWRDRALDAEAKGEQLEHLVHEHQHDIHFLFKDCKSLKDVANLVDSLRGEVLANQEQADRYRWLREREVAIFHDVGRTSPHDFKPIEESGDLLDAAIDRARLQW